MKSVAFYTLGCKLNFSETSTLARKAEEKGFRRVEFEQKPDVFIINTCSVTDNADKKCRKIVKEAQKINPEAFIAIVGCYAQLKPQEIASISGVDAVLGAAEKFQLMDLIPTFEKKKTTTSAQIFHQPISHTLDYHASYSLNDRTRTFLKVQDGCDYPCSYCTIPLARGKSRSDTIENVIRMAKEIREKDIKEIVLTGVNIGDFRHGEATFLELIQTLDKIQNNFRFRISSIEPNLLTNEIIDFVADSECIVPHFHIPLQSGSTAILAKMKRRYKVELYQNRIEYIKKRMPNCSVGVDVIVGHPGEGKEEFLETFHFLNDLDCSYLHVFSYSERPNTHAISIFPKVNPKEIESRSQQLHVLSEKKKRFFYENCIGQKANVLFEDEEKQGFMHGFTENYIKVAAKYDPLRINEIVPVRLSHLNEKGLMEVEEIEGIFEH